MLYCATNYVQASWIKSKKPKEVMINVMEKWISVYGPPKRILTDNGREFQNDLFYEMCESMDIKVLTTAAESP